MRLRNLIFLLMFAAATPGLRAACVPKRIVVESVERQAIVCAGKNENREQSVPLVLVFHGRGGSAANMADGTRIHEAWPDAVVAYLEGLTGNPAPYDPQGSRRGWQINPGELKDRDVRFVDAALDALNADYKLDAGRFYAVGHSNGARFAGILWATRASRFVAFAFSAGQADDLIEKAAPRPVFMSMGRRDEIIPFDWQKQSIGYARKLLKTEAGKAAEFGYTRSETAADGMELMTYVHPGGHVWPDVQTRLTVEFFKRHRLPARP